MCNSLCQVSFLITTQHQRATGLKGSEVNCSDEWFSSQWTCRRNEHLFTYMLPQMRLFLGTCFYMCMAEKVGREDQKREYRLHLMLIREKSRGHLLSLPIPSALLLKLYLISDLFTEHNKKCFWQIDFQRSQSCGSSPPKKSLRRQKKKAIQETDRQNTRWNKNADLQPAPQTRRFTHLHFYIYHLFLAISVTNRSFLESCSQFRPSLKVQQLLFAVLTPAIILAVVITTKQTLDWKDLWGTHSDFPTVRQHHNKQNRNDSEQPRTTRTRLWPCVSCDGEQTSSY